MTVRRRNFSIMEIMLAMILILMASGAIGIGIHRLNVKSRFDSAASRVERLLQTAEDLMIVRRHNASVTLKSSEEGLLVTLQPVPDELRRIIHTPVLLEAIDAFQLITPAGTEEEEFVLKFFAHGGVVTTGKLVLYSKSYGYSYSIKLGNGTDPDDFDSSTLHP